MKNTMHHFLEKTPYANNYGTALVNSEPDIECVTPWAGHFTGNPLLQAWHGGVVVGVLELTGALQALKASGSELPLLLTANVNFLRPTKGDVSVHTRAYIVRSGRQILNIDVVAWHITPEKLTAAASLTYSRYE